MEVPVNAFYPFPLRQTELRPPIIKKTVSCSLRASLVVTCSYE